MASLAFSWLWNVLRSTASYLANSFRVLYAWSWADFSHPTTFTAMKALAAIFSLFMMVVLWSICLFTSSPEVRSCFIRSRTSARRLFSAAYSSGLADSAVLSSCLSRSLACFLSWVMVMSFTPMVLVSCCISLLLADICLDKFLASFSRFWYSFEFFFPCASNSTMAVRRSFSSFFRAFVALVRL